MGAGLGVALGQTEPQPGAAPRCPCGRWDPRRCAAPPGQPQTVRQGGKEEGRDERSCRSSATRRDPSGSAGRAGLERGSRLLTTAPGAPAGGTRGGKKGEPALALLLFPLLKEVKRDRSELLIAPRACSDLLKVSKGEQEVREPLREQPWRESAGTAGRDGNGDGNRDGNGVGDGMGRGRAGRGGPGAAEGRRVPSGAEHPAHRARPAHPAGPARPGDSPGPGSVNETLPVTRAVLPSPQLRGYRGGC